MIIGAAHGLISKNSPDRGGRDFSLSRRQARPYHGGDPGGSAASALNMKILLLLVALLMMAGAALADNYRVHYSIRGSGRDITVQAESAADARRTVMDMFPGAVVTGAHRVKSAKD